jgi:hypothetical protein
MRTRITAALLAITLAAPAAWANAIIVGRPTPPPPPPPPPPPGTATLQTVAVGSSAAVAAVLFGLWLKRRTERCVQPVMP